MGRRGFGSIRRLPSNNYQARYLGPDGAEHKAPRTFSMKANAESWLVHERQYWDNLIATHSLNEWRSPEQRHLNDCAALSSLSVAPTLETYATRYMARPNLRPSYVARGQSLLKLHILPALGAVQIPNITKALVRGWWEDLDQDKKRTNDLAYQLLRAMMNAAIDDEHIRENPCTIRGAGKASNTKDDHTLIPEQVEGIAQEMPKRLSMAVRLMAWCGLRSGEVYELRRKDISQDYSHISIQRSVTRGPNGLTVGKPKTDTGVRTVEVPEPLRPLLKAHLNNHAQIGEEGLLFYSLLRGTHVLETERRTSFQKACALARYLDSKGHVTVGVSGFTPHDLRAFYETQLGIAGATVKERQVALGHSTTSMVARYDRIDINHSESVVRRLGERFERVEKVAM